MTNPLPSGAVTLLFTDIEESTQLWETHRSEMAVALTEHNRLLLEAVSRNEGVVVKDKGDGFMLPSVRRVTPLVVPSPHICFCRKWSGPRPWER